MTHEHEYNAIRNSAALIDISPLFKYRVTGGDATKVVKPGVVRDINKVAGDQGVFSCWCDPEGKGEEHGAVTRLGGNRYRRMVALDIARIEAGLILIEVDYISSKKSLIEEQRYTPGEIGLGKLVDLKKESFVGREALLMEAKKGGSARRLVGLEVNWNEVEALYEKIGMAPQVPSTASRVAVPVYREGRQVGKATSTTWSPTLKRMIALATVGRESAALG